MTLCGRKMIVAITGGIGAGKSVVSHMLRAMGLPVYDCDAAARRLMDESCEIKRCIAGEISASAIAQDGSICRQELSSVVFADSEKLSRLNAIVHGAVREDLKMWISRMDLPLIFVETAILYESGFDSMVDEIWEVTAPVEQRVHRVMVRSGLTEPQVRARIASQLAPSYPHHRIIDNSDSTPLIPQIINILNDYGFSTTVTSS